MAHDSERDFHRAVAGWLAQSFEDVDHEHTLESGRRPDFVAYTPFGSYVMEVESTGDKLYESIGQALVYAKETGHSPVIVFPAHDPPNPDAVPESVELVLV